MRHGCGKTQHAVGARMNLGIWGSYGYGNYGDEAMAVMLAEQARGKGVSPAVFRLDASLAQRYGASASWELEQFVHSADVILLGGGGILTTTPWWKRMLLNSSTPADHGVLELFTALSKHPRFCYSISIGGDGNETTTSRMPTPIQALISSPFYCGGTVRLPDDKRMLARLGKDVACYPDILFGIGSYWPRRRGRFSAYDGRWHIGVCISRLKGIWLFRNLLKFAKLHHDVVLHFIRSHRANCHIMHEIDANVDSAAGRIHLFQHEDPQQTALFIGALDAVISSRLHVGITAMSYGTLFMSYAGQPKTHSALRSLGLEHWYWPCGSGHRLLAQLERTLSRGKMTFTDDDTARLDEAKRACVNHLCRFHEILQPVLAPRELTEKNRGAK